MEIKNRALSEPYYLLLEQPESGGYWAADLDCGITVYQCEKDEALPQPQPWLRLKKFCEEQGANICGLSYFSSRNKVTSIKPNADGYFFSNKVVKGISMPFPQPNSGTFFVGIGFVEGSILNISWINTETSRVEQETRDLATVRTRPFGLITKHG